MKSVNVRQLESKLTWPNVTAAVGAKSAVASQFTGSWIRNVRPRGASLIARRRREVLQAAEVNVAGRADKASAAALGIEDSRITVHCGLGSEASGKEMSLSQSGGDGKLQATGVNVAGRADKASAAAIAAEVKVSSRAEEELQAAAVNRAGSSEEVSATAIGIRDSRSTVHCVLGSEASRKEISLSQSGGGDGKLQAQGVNVAVHADKASAAASAVEVKGSSRAEEELQAVDLNTAVNLRKASGISHTVDLRRRVYRRMAADPTEEERRKRIRDQREEV